MCDWKRSAMRALTRADANIERVWNWRKKRNRRYYELYDKGWSTHPNPTDFHRLGPAYRRRNRLEKRLGITRPRW